LNIGYTIVLILVSSDIIVGEVDIEVGSLYAHFDLPRMILPYFCPEIQTK